MNTLTIETLQFTMKGMTCGGCVRSVQRVLGNVSGIVDSNVSVGNVVVIIDTNKVNAQEIEGALKKTGFVPELQRGETK
jgi:copper chaperone CopZ